MHRLGDVSPLRSRLLRPTMACSALPNSLLSSPQSGMGSVGGSAGSVWVCWLGRPQHSCTGHHSCVGGCFKAPRMGHRTGSAGIQVTALTQFFQRGNLNRLAGEGWEIEIPQGQNEGEERRCLPLLPHPPFLSSASRFSTAIWSSIAKDLRGRKG